MRAEDVEMDLEQKPHMVLLGRTRINAGEDGKMSKTGAGKPQCGDVLPMHFKSYRA
jgi:hypothetical protein